MEILFECMVYSLIITSRNLFLEWISVQKQNGEERIRSSLGKRIDW